MTQRDRINFNLRRNERGKYPTGSITLSDVPAGFLDKFDEKVIERAKELKAKQIALGTQATHNYTDAYYLEYAKSLELRDIIGRLREIHKNRANQYEINEMEWAQYSYEEIIQMENDGYDIPQDVLMWAHAQQQSDVTDYIVVADSTETDDASSTGEEISTDELSNMRAQSLKDIANIEKAEKETQKTVIEYRRAEKKAKKIQDDKQDNYIDSMKEIKTLTDEWKELNDKKEGGKLTKEEEKRLKFLNKQINGADGKLMKEMKVANAELDDFLTNLDILNDKIDSNIELSTETIQNATDLSNLEKQYNPTKLPYVNKGIRFNGMGLSSSSLYGIRVEDISNVAMKKAKDFEVVSNDLITYLDSDESTKLVDFATDYTAKATETEENTKETMGENFDEGANGRKKKEKDTYHVEKIFSYANAMYATATTISATTDLLTKDSKAQKHEKALKAQIKKSEKDTKDLDKEVNNAEAEHETNMQEEEIFLAQLESLNENAADDITEEDTDDVTSTGAKNSQTEELNSEEDTPVDQTEEVPADDKNTEKETLLTQLTDIQERDKHVGKGVEKALLKSKTSTMLGAKFAKTLKDSNSDLIKSKNVAQKVAADTTIVGIGTTAQGYMNTVIGAEMIAAGTFLVGTGFPPDVVAGGKLIHAGGVFVGIGTMEIVSGIAASTTGFATLAISSEVQAVSSVHNAVTKSAQQTVKGNQSVINEASKTLGITTGNTDNTTQGSEQNSTTETEGENSGETAEITVGTTAGATGNLSVASNESSDATPVANGQNTTENQITPSQNETEDEPTKENNRQTTETNKANSTTNKDDQVKNTRRTTRSKASTNNGNENVEDETNKAKSELPSVEKEFTVSGAVKATATTIKATADVFSSMAGARQKEAAFDLKMKKITQLNKLAEKNKALTEAAHKAAMQKAQSKKSQMENVNLEMQNAAEEGNEESFVAAQINMQNLDAEMNTAVSSGEKVTDKFTDNINSINDNIQVFQKEQGDLKNELNTFNKKIDNQLDVSQDTIVTGIGTYGAGVLKRVEAIGEAIIGAHMLAAPNPIVQIAGMAIIAKAAIKWDLSLGYTIAGATALVTGAAGLVAHSTAKDAKSTIDGTHKVGGSFLALTRNSMKNHSSTANEIDKENEQMTQEAEILSASASASTNSNIANNTETDDKADRRLTRFNNDSIIESKKKRKKVVGVSASAGGGI